MSVVRNDMTGTPASSSTMRTSFASADHGILPVHRLSETFSTPVADADEHWNTNTRPWRRLDACTDRRWLFIFSAGGRTGSTTIVRMLNAVPQISLSGENADLYSRLDALLQSTLRLGLNGLESWLNTPNATMLQAAVCSWLLAIAPQPSALVHGFKEIRTQSAAAIAKALPNARFVLSYREDIAAQIHSLRTIVGQFNWKGDAEGPMKDLNELRCATRGQRVFDLPVERFNVSIFNALLRFIGVTDCRYTGIAHANKQFHASGLRASNGYSGYDPHDPVASSRGLLQGTCKLTAALFDAVQLPLSPQTWQAGRLPVDLNCTRRVLHFGQDCWEPCGYQQGACSSYCGAHGACCRAGFAKSPAECGLGSSGCDDKHCCTQKAFAPKRL